MNIKKQHELAEELIQLIAEIEILHNGELLTLGREHEGSISIYLNNHGDGSPIYITPFVGLSEDEDILTDNNFIQLTVTNDGVFEDRKIPYGAKFENFADDIDLYVEKINDALINIIPEMRKEVDKNLAAINAAALTDKQIMSLADDALNAACLTIQNQIGQDDGGNAAMYFSDDEVLNRFADYIRFELASMASDK